MGKVSLLEDRELKLFEVKPLAQDYKLVGSRMLFKLIHPNLDSRIHVLEYKPLLPLLGTLTACISG